MHLKGLKIIPMFLILLVFSYFGILFIEANREEVVINFGSYQFPPTALGFAILTSTLIGMLVAIALCVIEMAALYYQNKALKRKLTKNKSLPSIPEDPPLMAARTREL